MSHLSHCSYSKPNQGEAEGWFPSSHVDLIAAPPVNQRSNEASMASTQYDGMLNNFAVAVCCLTLFANLFYDTFDC